MKAFADQLLKTLEFFETRDGGHVVEFVGYRIEP